MFRFTIRDVLWLMVVVAMGCNRQPPNAASNPQFDAQIEETNRRSKVANQLLADQEASVQRAKELLSKQEGEAHRMARLLDKMEEQARRKDAILDAEEKQLGIKK
jgi:hypothetical protein